MKVFQLFWLNTGEFFLAFIQFSTFFTKLVVSRIKYWILNHLKKILYSKYSAEHFKQVILNRYFWFWRSLHILFETPLMPRHVIFLSLFFNSILLNAENFFFFILLSIRYDYKARWITSSSVSYLFVLFVINEKKNFVCVLGCNFWLMLRVG